MSAESLAGQMVVKMVVHLADMKVQMKAAHSELMTVASMVAMWERWLVDHSVEKMVWM